MLPPVSITVYAKDATRLAAFYEGALGLPRVEETAGFVLLAAGGLALVVVQAPDEAVADVTITEPPEVREATPVKASFLVDDLERRRPVIAALGGGLRPADAAWSWRGARHLDGWDPEGNVFQLRQAEA